MFNVDAIIAFFVVPMGDRPPALLPVVDDTCLCGRKAVINAVGVHASRVRGDSANGYRTYHDRCMDAVNGGWPLPR